jgi:glycerol-3-phosphate acyltransferase PlsX
MSEETKVALDLMGGDNAPKAMIEGAVEALKENESLKIICFGNDEAEKELERFDFDKDRLIFRKTAEVIATDESPVKAISEKKDSSLVMALKCVKHGEADAFVSAGNSGAILAGGQIIIGRIKGIKRAPFAPIIPTDKGPALLLDAGANVDCRSENLVQFARMGAVYMRPVLKREPRVGILNLGAEDDKGNALVKETFPLLKEASDIDFIGSVESRDIPFGAADVIVTEAFTGNAVLKMYEGTAKLLQKLMKKAFLSNIKSKIGAALVLPSLKEELKNYDTKKYGGAPMLGLNGLAVKAHGSSGSEEIKNALLQCIDFKNQHILESIRDNIGIT